MKKLLSQSLLLIAISISSYAQIVTDIPMNYTFSGPFSAMAVNPWSSQHIILAAETGGLFETRNAGGPNRRWNPLYDFKQHEIQDVLITQANAGFDVWVAGSNTFDEEPGVLLWKRNVAGAWSRVRFRDPIPEGKGRTYRLINDVSTGNIYACGDYGLAIISRESNIVRPLPSNLSVFSMEVLKFGRILAGTTEGIYYSDNRGDNWTLVSGSPGFTDGNTRFCLTADNAKNIALALSFNAATSRFVAYGSVNQGLNWTAFNKNIIHYAANAGGLASIKTNNTTNLAGEVKLSIYISNKYKVSYATASASSVQIALSTMLSNSALVWRGDATDPFVGHADTRQIAFLTAGVFPQKMVVTTDGGFHIADIRGDNYETYSWQTENITSGLKSLQVTTVTGTRSKIYFGTWHNCFGASSDLGTTFTNGAAGEGWVLNMVGIPGTYASRPMVMEGPKFDTRIFGLTGPPDEPWNNPSAGTNGGPIYAGGRIYIQQADKPATATTYPWKITTNSSTSWQDLPACNFNRFGLSLNNLGYSRAPFALSLFIGLNDNGVLKIGKLTNPVTPASASWSYPSLNGLNGGIAGMSYGTIEGAVFAVNTLTAENLLAAEASTGILKRSIDGGDNWTEVTTFNNLYRGTAATGLKKFKSNNGYNAIQCISYSTFESGVVLVGTLTEGLFLSRDGGTTWSKLNNPGVLAPTNFHWLSATTVMLATYGRGLFKIQL